MTLHLTAKPAKDGGGTTIPGGVNFNDQSGANTGPFNLAQVLIDSTQAEILGTTADPKSALTDSTPTTLTSVLKQISFSIQAVAAGVIALGTNVMANSMPVTVATNDTVLGPTNDTAASTDTATASINARLQRVCQRLTSLIALQPGIGAGSVLSVNALAVTAATDQATIAVTQDTSKIGSGTAGTFLTPAWAKINIASATTTTAVPLVAAKKIRILACYLVDGGANNINWQSHTTTSNGDAPLNLSAGSGLVLPFNPCGWFETTAGEALDIVTSTSAQLSGRIQYVAV